MLNELAMAFQVIIRPNQAFATLRDNHHRYFLPSIAVVLLVSAVHAGLDSATPAIAAIFGLNILGIVASAGTIVMTERNAMKIAMVPATANSRTDVALLSVKLRQAIIVVTEVIAQAGPTSMTASRAAAVTFAPRSVFRRMACTI